uniref:Uncharacterized protein n=1 Tax=Polytomella parva TaxID=51329 RepID=A0A7S0V5T2_9CHLO|mmetsp:Transcript_31058/g.56452  ORF Transcript_31058/g.56452 Transcript_31058/m.56452 type:complete len:502 (+) Transcript_31058:57-1562(+)|eukprot:CAMPEP_0175052644 /NCGR_PEP_ID=MMETSP0052_2-20121109/8475_1 /TAXON_ID=51329 ORGANISM="Polytomella parva, Strain SAG 63-3" /NCGR_SAMPLE_ID=MMETSP0052_2 /ASSEMBLY_ACC=CAM_ASM_000194 /LENGTH=501 /DNA_ID=CAMNT_0016317073 /DNA_START=1 /DNA_END=1506 /DNA_ORIENTATION=+
MNITGCSVKAAAGLKSSSTSHNNNRILFNGVSLHNNARCSFISKRNVLNSKRSCNILLEYSSLLSSSSTYRTRLIDVSVRAKDEKIDNGGKPTQISVKEIISKTWSLVFNSGVLPELLVAYAYKDLIAFLINRVSHLVTNTVASHVLGVEVFNPWWIYLDPNFLQATPGYVFIVAFFFIATLPLITLVDSFAFATAAAILRRRPPPPLPLPATAPMDEGKDLEGGNPPSGGDSFSTKVIDSNSSDIIHDGVKGGSDKDVKKDAKEEKKKKKKEKAKAKEEKTKEDKIKRNAEIEKALESFFDPSKSTPPPAPKASATESLFKRLWQAHVASLAAIKEESKSTTPFIWRTDLGLMWHALPYQLAALLVLPAAWALPRLFEMQLSSAVASEEFNPHQGGKEKEKEREKPWTYCNQKSKELMKGNAWKYALPFLLFRGVLHLCDYMHGQLLALVPKRWWSEVVEIPLALTVLLMILRSLSGRLLNVLPLATMELCLEKKTKSEI